MPRLFITRRIPEAGLDPLAGLGLTTDIRAADDAIARPELLERVRGADALITFLSDAVDGELLDAAGPQLRAVANFAVGYDNVDVAACSERGVVVSNTPGVLTDATADFAWALILAVGRRVVEGHRLASSGRWDGWKPLELLGVGLSGKTLGVVGMGRIGRAVARRGLGFGLRIVYHNRSRDQNAERELGAGYRDRLDDLLAESDIVSLHTPLTPKTRHLIGERELERMRPGAILINTARGPVIDEAALVVALSAGTIRGAGLDVFEQEPEIDPGLLALENVVLAPHLGSATEGARGAMARLCGEAVSAVLRGERAPNLLNPEVLDR
jgi:glyoxylate reductase